LYPVISTLSGICVNSMVSYNNTTWIGTVQGLFRLDKDKKTLNRSVNRPLDNLSIPGNNVTSLLIDNKHNLVVGTETGLGRMDMNTGLFE